MQAMAFSINHPLRRELIDKSIIIENEVRGEANGFLRCRHNEFNEPSN
jgi:hypothetical protein